MSKSLRFVLSVILVLSGGVFWWFAPGLRAQPNSSISLISPIFFDLSSGPATLTIQGSGFSRSSVLRLGKEDIVPISVKPDRLDFQISPKQLQPGVFRLQVVSDGLAVPLAETAPRFYSRDFSGAKQPTKAVDNFDIMVLGPVARNPDDRNGYIDADTAIVAVDQSAFPTPEAFAKKVGNNLESWLPHPIMTKSSTAMAFQSTGSGICGQTMILLSNSSAGTMAERLNTLASLLSGIDFGSVVYTIDPIGHAGHPVLQALQKSLVGLGNDSYKNALEQIQARALWEDPAFASTTNGQITALGGPVAVLDTGVSAHPEFLKNQLVNPTNLTIDPSNPTRLERERDGSGNPIWTSASDFEDANDFWHGPATPKDPGSARVGHGTAAAGVIAAANTAPVNLTVAVPGTSQTHTTPTLMVGVAAGAKIMPVRVCNASTYGGCQGISVIAGICSAVSKGAKVINMSLSGPQATKSLELALRVASNAGIPIVAAAGNISNTTQAVATRQYPAAYAVDFLPHHFKIPGLIAVGAVSKSGVLARYSPRTATNTSPDWVSLTAPGGEIVPNPIVESSGFPTSDALDMILVPGMWGTFGDPNPAIPRYWYWRMSGTSIAAPFVTGAATLLRAKCPTSTVENIKLRITSTAAGPNKILNVSAALTPPACP